MSAKSKLGHRPNHGAASMPKAGMHGNHCNHMFYKSEAIKTRHHSGLTQGDLANGAINVRYVLGSSRLPIPTLRYPKQPSKKLPV